MILCLIGFVSLLIWLTKELHHLPGFFQRGKSLAQTLGKCVVITGCTDGIGQAFARLVARQKVPEMILISRNEEKLSSMKKELETLGPKVSTLAIDFATKSNAQDYQALASLLKDRQISCLISSVGLSYPGAQYYHELPIAFIEELIAVNVMATIMITKYCMDAMRRHKPDFGSILLMGSAASTVAEPLLSGYSATKGCVSGFAESLSAECVGSDIGVQCQVPFMVATKMSKIRKSSFIVPSPRDYAQVGLSALRFADNRSAMNSLSAEVQPFWGHRLIKLAHDLAIPEVVWHWSRVNSQKIMRKRLLLKRGRGCEMHVCK